MISFPSIVQMNEDSKNNTKHQLTAKKHFHGNTLHDDDDDSSTAATTKTELSMSSSSSASTSSSCSASSSLTTTAAMAVDPTVIVKTVSTDDNQHNASDAAAWRTSNNTDCGSGRSVSFSDVVRVRKHVHRANLTEKEITSCWFQQSEYIKIFKNNSNIIRCLGLLSKKKNKKMKKKLKKSGSFRLTKKTRWNGNAVADNADDIYDDDIEEEERRGYSIRGLENETSSARQMRDQIYVQAKYVVLSVQEEFASCVNEVMTMRKEEEFQCDDAVRNNNDDDVDENAITSSELFQSDIAQRYYDECSLLMAKRYKRVCEPPVKEARERALRDERIAWNIRFSNSSSSSVPQQPQQQKQHKKKKQSVVVADKTDVDNHEDDVSDDDDEKIAAAVRMINGNNSLDAPSSQTKKKMEPPSSPTSVVSNDGNKDVVVNPMKLTRKLLKRVSFTARSNKEKKVAPDDTQQHAPYRIY